MQPAKDDNVNDHSTTQQGQDNEPTLGSHSPVDAEMNDDDDEDEDEIMEGTGDTIVGSASEGWSLYAGDTQMLPTGPSQPVDSTSPQHLKTDIDTDAKSTTEVSAKQDHLGNAEPPVETADDAHFICDATHVLEQRVHQLSGLTEMSKLLLGCHHIKRRLRARHRRQTLSATDTVR